MLNFGYAFKPTISECLIIMYLCIYILHIHTIFTNAGIADITNGRAMVVLDELDCGETYTITARGTLNGSLVGPETVTTCACPPGMPTVNISYINN